MKDMVNIANRHRRQFLHVFLFLAIWVVLSIILAIRAQFGYVFNDEPFIISTVKRFYEGAVPFSDEWHPAQTIGFVLLPMYSLWKMIRGTSEGMFLFFRIVYAVCWTFVCLRLGFYLKRRFGRVAYPVFAYIWLFSPLDQMTLSYTSISLMCIIYALFIWIDTKKHTGSIQNGVRLVLSGVCVAIAVLCYPYLIAIYFLSVILLSFGSILAKRSSRYGEFRDTIKRIWCVFGLVTVGCVIILIPFLIFLFSRVSVGELIDAVRHVLQNTNSSRTDIVGSLCSYFIDIFQQAGITAIVSILISGVLLCPLQAVKGIRQKLLCRFSIFVALCGLLTLIILKNTLDREIAFNAYMLDMALVAIPLYLLLETKPKDLFCMFFVSGILYSLIVNLSSDTGINAIAQGLTLCGICGVICATLLLREFSDLFKNVSKTGRVLTALCSLLVITQVGSGVFVKLTRQYWDATPIRLSYTIETGPAKRLRTSANRYEEYILLQDRLQHLLEGKETDGKTFMSYTFIPIVYFMTEMKIASYSAWTYDDSLSEEYHEKLRVYFADDSHEYPDYIFIFHEEESAQYMFIDGYIVERYEDSVLLIKQDEKT